jgi:hypothetical protein
MGVLFVAAVMLDVVHSESNIAPSASSRAESASRAFASFFGFDKLEDVF